jgi:transcriptional/translational regulatory protein YebC/TACO1
METVLEVEAEDMEYNDDTARIICPMDSFAIVNKNIEERNIEITEAKLEYIAKNIVNISDIEVAKKVLKFIEVFEDHDDVQNVYYNFVIDDGIADLLE